MRLRRLAAALVLASCAAFGQSGSGETPPPPAYVTGGTVGCAGTSCEGAVAYCCINNEQMGFCTDAGNCTGETSLALHCDDAHDCGQGYFCCARLVGQAFSSVGCELACSGPGAFRVCGDPDPNTCDTDAGEQCMPLPQALHESPNIFTALRVCQRP
jgi:hypothetical protein